MTVTLEWILKNWKLLGSLLLLAASYFYGDSAGSDRVQRSWDVDIAIHVKERLAAVEENQKLIVALEETKNENIATVNTLHKQLALVRVSMPKACGTITPSGSQDAVTPSGNISVEPQAAFDNFERGVESDAYAADQIVESCRVLRDWAASIK